MCYYSSFNFPAFVYVLGPQSWDRFQSIYVKCAKFADAKIQKTLAHSIHELSDILGPDITQADLVPIMKKFLEDKDIFKEAHMGALKNLHVFLK